VTFKDTPWMVDKAWLSGTPKAIRQQAVFEVVKNFKVAFTDNAHDNIDKFKVSYKKKRHHAQRPWSVGIGKAMKIDTDADHDIFLETLGKMRYSGKLPFDEKPKVECGIHRNTIAYCFLRVLNAVSVEKSDDLTKESSRWVPDSASL